MSLREIAREASAQLLRWSGAPWLLRRAHRRDAAIPLYHDPSPAVIDAHIRHLQVHYTFTTLDVVVEAIARRDWSAVPEGALVVTLDDGHRGNYALLPVFRRYGVVPTIYLCSQVVATPRRFWFQQPGRDTQPYKRLRNDERIAALVRECALRARVRLSARRAPGALRGRDRGDGALGRLSAAHAVPPGRDTVQRRGSVVRDLGVEVRTRGASRRSLRALFVPERRLPRARGGAGAPRGIRGRAYHRPRLDLRRRLQGQRGGRWPVTQPAA